MDIRIIIINIMSIGIGIVVMLWYIARFRKEWYEGTLKNLEIISKRIIKPPNMSNTMRSMNKVLLFSKRFFLIFILIGIFEDAWLVIKYSQDLNVVTNEMVITTILSFSTTLYCIIFYFVCFFSRSYYNFIFSLFPVIEQMSDDIIELKK